MAPSPRSMGLLLLGILPLTLPVRLAAQEKKDDPPAQAVIKTIRKIAGPKEKDEKPAPEDYPRYVQSVRAKIRRISGENQEVLTIEYQLVDPAKVAKFQEWYAKQMTEIGAAKEPKEYYERALQFEKDLPAKQKDIYTAKEIDVRAVENVKVRSMEPPQEYDDRGFLKKWTQKELADLRGNTKLPGYPVTLEVLRVDRIVEVYVLPPPRSKAEKKLAVDQPKEMPQAVLIVIMPQS
jgi:hypothetical protein